MRLGVQSGSVFVFAPNPHLEGQRRAENARMRTRWRTLYGRVAVVHKKAHKKKTGKLPVFYLKLFDLKVEKHTKNSVKNVLFVLCLHMRPQLYL